MSGIEFSISLESTMLSNIPPNAERIISTISLLLADIRLRH